MGGVLVYLRAGLKLFDKLFLMFEIQLDTFLNIFILQNFVDSGNLIDETCRGVPKAVMCEMLERARAFVPAAELRGI